MSQSSPHVEHFRREAGGEWRYRVARAGSTLTLKNGASLDVDTIYQGVFDLEGE